jgi:hypothetical protein
MSKTAEYRLYTPRLFNATTRQRFFRSRKNGMVRHVGSSPSRAQLILIGRIVQNEWDLLRLDAKMEGGLSGHDMRARLAMENRLRLDLRDLGLQGATAKPPSLADYIASKVTKKAASEQEGAAA